MINRIIRGYFRLSAAAADRITASFDGYAPSGEGPVHLAVKKLIAADPAKALKERGLVLCKMEYQLPTGDSFGGGGRAH